MIFVKRLCAVLLGAVFFVAGLLKLMDPVGDSLIVGEYLNFLHLGFLGFASGIAAMGMALIETITGAALITGVWNRLFAPVCGILLGTFTLLTAALWAFNPPMDCGCFGEAVHLTHFQSFAKNIVLCILWAVAFVPECQVKEPRKSKYAAFCIVSVSVCLFCAYSIADIPIRDYTHFAPGTELRYEGEEGMEDAPLLSFFDADWEYRDSLALRGDVIVVSVYKPSAVRNWDKLESYIASLEKKGFTTILLVSDDAPVECFYADRKDLLTLNRSNAGVTYISDGRIITKWSCLGRPSGDRLEKIITTGPDQVMMNSMTASKLRFQGLLLYVFAVMLLL